MFYQIKNGADVIQSYVRPRDVAELLRGKSSIDGIVVTTHDPESCLVWDDPAVPWLRRYAVTGGNPELADLEDHIVDALLEIKDLASAALGEHSPGTDEQAAAAATFRAILAKVESIFTP